MRSSSKRRLRGFTLIEALIALVMLGVIMFALTMALSVALRTQEMSMHRQDDAGEIRAIIDSLTRDISSAQASLNNPLSAFIAGGAQASSTATSSGLAGGLLTFTTLSHRISANDPNMDPGMAAILPPVDPSPQADTALIRYDLNPGTGILMRTETAIPNAQALSTTPPGPANMLSQRVIDLTFRYWDTTQQTWRTDWDFEQTNQTQQSQTGTSTTAANSQTSTDPNAASNTTTGDTMLPGAVEVNLTLMSSNGQPVTYTTLIPISASHPMPTITLPTSTANATPGSATTGAQQ